MYDGPEPWPVTPTFLDDQHFTSDLCLTSLHTLLTLDCTHCDVFASTVNKHQAKIDVYKKPH